MKDFFTKAATTALTGLAVFGFASAAFATPETTQIREGSIDAHAALVRAVERAGVDVQVNHPFCQKMEGLNGFYRGEDRLLVVCNDNYSEATPTPRWTPNDFDTLRHEAQHFIQDCTVGTNHDHHLNNVYKNPVRFSTHVLGQLAIDRITTLYRQKGASDHILRLEYEAFAVAALNVPLEQAQDVSTYCLGGN